MRRTLMTFLCVMLPAMAGQRAWGFSLEGPSLGPDTSWQTEALGYNLGTYDVGAPKQIGQGYRRNSPVIYYAYDDNFLQFFDPSLEETDGVAAVDGAFDIMNALPNADSIQLSNFPLNSQMSWGAGTLGLLDLKSSTLGALMEQIGLDQPVRYTWTLHDQYLPAGAVCSTNPAINGEEYLVTQRNIDPGSLTYSSYVDGTLYFYRIFEDCGTIGVFPYVIIGLDVDALALPYPTDTDAQTYQPVAEEPDFWGAEIDVLNSTGPSSYYSGALAVGDFYTGLTYDDAGGYRYLYSTNNVNYETPAPGTQLEVTNTAQLLLLQTGNLYALMQFAQTNPPAAVQAAFPGIAINDSSSYFTLVTNWTIYSYFTNYPGSPADSPPVLVIGTNGYTLGVQTNYLYVFGNVVPVNYYTNTKARLVTTSLSTVPGSPADHPLIKTNVTTKYVTLTNVVSGNYYIIPTNTCGYEIVGTLVSNYFAGTVTNVIAVATNNVSTNAAGFVGSETLLVNWTNNWFEYYACALQTPATTLYQGVGKINFVKADYDSTLGQFFSPITTNYTMVIVTNSQLKTLRFQRTVTQPDILLSAEDLVSPVIPFQIGGIWPPYSRTVTYTQDPQLAGSAPASGPGTITDYPTTITYNDANIFGRVPGSDISYAGFTNANLNAVPPLFTWGSFDESTNPPVVYPVGTSLQNLENAIVIQISPSSLPDATNGVAYSPVTFQTTGGSFTPPYTWSLGTNVVTLTQTPLPPGLALSSGGTISGTPTTTNEVEETYDFVLQMTDVNGRGVTWNYSINVDP